MWQQHSVESFPPPAGPTKARNHYSLLLAAVGPLLTHVVSSTCSPTPQTCGQSSEHNTLTTSQSQRAATYTGKCLVPCTYPSSTSTPGLEANTTSHLCKTLLPTVPQDDILLVVCSAQSIKTAIKSGACGATEIERGNETQCVCVCARNGGWSLHCSR